MNDEYILLHSLQLPLLLDAAFIFKMMHGISYEEQNQNEKFLLRNKSDGNLLSWFPVLQQALSFNRSRWMTELNDVLWMKFFFYVDEKCWWNKFQCCCPDKSQKWPFFTVVDSLLFRSDRIHGSFHTLLFLLFNFSFYGYF